MILQILSFEEFHFSTVVSYLPEKSNLRVRSNVKCKHFIVCWEYVIYVEM